MVRLSFVFHNEYESFIISEVSANIFLLGEPQIRRHNGTVGAVGAV